LDSSIYRVIATFFVGGLWITLTTIIAEQAGPRLGGVIGGLPSTIVVALGSIAWIQGAHSAYEATTTLPLIFALNAVFLILYAALVTWHGTFALASALGVWLGAQALLIRMGPPSLGWTLVCWLVALLGGYWVLVHLLHVAPTPAPGVRVDYGNLLLRAVLSGTVVACAVVFSRISGPLWGAVFAAFPAVYCTTLFVAQRTVGAEFARSLTVPLLVSSIINCVIYGLVFRITVLDWGWGWALVVAYVCALPSALFTYRFLGRWHSAGPTPSKGVRHG